MGEIVLKDQAMWLGGYELTGNMNALAIDHGAEMVDRTAFGDSTRRRLGGLKDTTIQGEGYVDVAVLDKALFDAIGVNDTPMSFGAQGAAEGEIAYSLLADLAEYVPGGTIGEMFGFSVSAQGSGTLVRGTLMHNATRTVSANGTARQLGAAAAGQKLYAALHVLSASPGDTLDVSLESDASNSFAGGETTRITFAQAAAIGAQWAAPVAGPITDTWWRLAWSIGGASPSFKFVVVVGIQ